MSNKKKVSFWATKRVPKTVKVKFKTARGSNISFSSTKRVPKRVRVSFYAKRKKHTGKKLAMFIALGALAGYGAGYIIDRQRDVTIKPSK